MDFTALRYALEQELFINGLKLIYEEKEQESVLERFLGPIFFPLKKHKQANRYGYLGCVELGERITYYWLMLDNPRTRTKSLVTDRLFAIRTYPANLTDQEGQVVDPKRDILKIVAEPDDSITSEIIDNPLVKIATHEMTLKELIASGEYELPPPVMRDLNRLKVTEPYDFEPWSWLDYRAEVLVPLLGIKLIPESDFEFVQTIVPDEDMGIVKFGYSREYYSSRRRIGFSGYY